MQELKNAFENAELYDKYVFTKMYAYGYIIWAFVGGIGSWISYLIIIFGEALAIDTGYTGAALGLLWILLPAFGILFGFNLSPTEMANVTGFKGSKGYGITWVIAYALAFFFDWIATSQNWTEVSAIFGVSVMIAVGQIGTFLINRMKSDLFVGAVGLLVAVLLIPVPYPYEMIIFGFGLFMAYYSVGFKVYKIDLPKILRKNK